MKRLVIITVVALLASACAAIPEPARPVVASSVFTPMPSAHAQISRPGEGNVSSELECMADCLADETCEVCAETCLR